MVGNVTERTGAQQLEIGRTLKNLKLPQMTIKKLLTFKLSAKKTYEFDVTIFLTETKNH